MTKLPDIESVHILREIIIRNASTLTSNDDLVELIQENIEKFDEETRRSLYELMREQTLPYGG